MSRSTVKEKLRVSLLSWGREGKGSEGKWGRLRVSPDCPGLPDPCALPAGSLTVLWTLRVWRLWAEGPGETLGPFSTVREALAGGEVRDQAVCGVRVEGEPAEGGDRRVSCERVTSSVADRFRFHVYKHRDA